MTAQELRSHLDRVFGLHDRPRTYDVDAITYANCCQAVFTYLLQKQDSPEDIVDHIHGQKILFVSVGPGGGLMFKGVELILKI